MGRTKEGRRVKDRKISLDGSQGRQSNKSLTDRHCGPCTITTDRSKEKTADAILIDNGPLHLWQLVSYVLQLIRTQNEHLDYRIHHNN